MNSSKDTFEVTPWGVSGVVDYEKLIKEFGTQPLTDDLIKKIELLVGEVHFMIRRKVFFSHRDLDLALSDYENGIGFFLYTGRGPSGPMHLGHIVPFYFTKWLQDKFNANLYIQVTDDEKFLEEKRNLSWEEVRKWTNENILDIAAVGFNPDKTFIFTDTEYMWKIYPIAIKVARKINFSLAKAVFGFDLQTNIGMIFYPAIQIVPTLFEKKRCLIPAAIDQDPYWRIQRDIAEDLGYYKTSAMHSKFIPPLTGFQGKMSSSKPETAIYLSDDAKTIRTKVYKYAFSGGRATIEEHRKYGGDPSVDVSFQWLYMFLEEDDKKVKRIEEDYRNGKLLTGELKDILIEKLVTFLEKHKERREKAKEIVNLYKYEGKLAKEMWSDLKTQALT
ncbi:MAG: tryptophan--tRNA ligase [Candidatus Brockarchaeota archaeon]|nr:tryptophan--tRNA ligase [Candidatus Brockarchaeota archaeon]MBO3768295.1 tryptophan--tRNA ligase [Candidatus Brockarchaeota archaeon]MBO3801601.1 tryptophan--tRNA ligase [Candidatus Brockarchaeota archaeon]